MPQEKQRTGMIMLKEVDFVNSTLNYGYESWDCYKGTAMQIIYVEKGRSMQAKPFGKAIFREVPWYLGINIKITRKRPSLY